MIFQQQFDYNTRLSLVIEPHIFFSQLWNETLSLFLWNVCYACNFKMKIIEDKVCINSILTNWIKRLVCGLEFYCHIGNRWVYHLLMSSWYVLHVLAYYSVFEYNLEFKNKTKRDFCFIRIIWLILEPWGKFTWISAILKCI